MKTALELITPERAREYLKKNRGNRTIKNRWVETYARDMASGAWKLTHQGIAFDKDGFLVDGQHRLLAIIRANKPIYMMVSRDLEPDTRLVLDQGVNRSAVDALKIADGGDTIFDGHLVAFIRMFTAEKLGIKNRTFSAREIREFAEKYPAVVRIYDRLRRRANWTTTAVYTALAAAVLNGESIEAATAFVATIVTNAINPQYNCKAALDFIKASGKMFRSGAERREQMKQAENAFYLYAHNKKRTTSTEERYKVTAEQCKTFTEV